MYIYEHILAKVYKWSLSDIREMDYYDFQTHLTLCLVSEDIEMENRAKLAGIDPGKKSGNKTTRKVGRNKYIQEQQLLNFG